MVATLLTLSVALLALVLAYTLLLRAHSGVRDDQDWERRKHLIDVEMFRAVLDRNEEIQLRRFLPSHQFHRFQRRRINVALQMLRLVDQNAGMAMEMGRLAKLKGDPAITAQVDHMIVEAFQLRLNLLLARFCLYLKWIFPSWAVTLPAFESRYQHLLDSINLPAGALA